MTYLRITLLFVVLLASPAAAPAQAQGKPPALDFYGDPLPPGALARLGTVSLSHEHGCHVAYSADGRILVSAGAGVVRLWDAATGRELGHFPGSRGFTLSADGTRLASQSAGSLGAVSVWDTRSGKELHRLEAHAQEVFALAFSPDGKLLATGGLDGVLRLWNTATGKQVGLLANHGGYISGVAFSADGRTLFSREVMPMPDDGGPLRSEASLTITRLWEVASGKERQRFAQHVFLTLAPAGEVMATARTKSHVVQLVNWRTGYSVRSLSIAPGTAGGLGGITSACFAADGKVLATASANDPAVRLWDVETGIAVGVIPLADYALSLAVSPDGKTIAVGVPSYAPDHNRIRLFDAASGEERFLSPGVTGPVLVARFLPGGKALACAGADNTFRIWQLATGKLLRKLELPSRPRAMAPDGSLVAVSGKGDWSEQREKSLEVWDTTTGKVRHTLQHQGRVARVAWAPDGATLAVGVEGEEVYLWDPATGKLRQRWAAAATWSLVFSADGQTLATGDGDCTVRLWQVATGKLLRQLGTPIDRAKFGGPIIAGTTAIALSPDGKIVAAGAVSLNTITVWNAATGEELRKWEAHPLGHNEGWIYALTFVADGKTLISASKDRTIRVWDSATGKERSLLRGHRGPVQTLVLSPDGTRLASGSQDGTLLIWGPLAAGQ
jgi:WD40 repeat protein